MSEWISVEERLPESEEVLIATGFNFNKQERGRWVEPAFFVDGAWHPVTSQDCEAAVDFSCNMHPPTHWQPLPEPPK